MQYSNSNTCNNNSKTCEISKIAIATLAIVIATLVIPMAIEISTLAMAIATIEIAISTLAISIVIHAADLASHSLITLPISEPTYQSSFLFNYQHIYMPTWYPSDLTHIILFTTYIGNNVYLTTTHALPRIVPRI